METDFTAQFGPKTWGAIFLVCFLATFYLTKRIATCCLFSQRAKLRDDYEGELRRGGKLTNRLLLPTPQRVDWKPHATPSHGSR